MEDMLQITVKTLDSRNHSFSIDGQTTVRQFKEHIESTVNISANSQRLIYCGRVLQDNVALKDYDVNGKVIHLVQRAPPGSGGNGGDRGSTRTRTPGSNPAGPRRTHQWRTFIGPGGNSGNTMYLGAMAFPSDISETPTGNPSAPQNRQCMSHNRLVIVRNILRRASNTVRRLESTSTSSSDTFPENGNSPPETSAEDVVGAQADTTVEEVSVGTSVGETEGAALGIGPTPSSFIIGELSLAPEREAVPEPETASIQNEPQPESTSTSQQPTGNENGEETPSEPIRLLNLRFMADLLDQVTEINNRLQPFMTQYQQLLRDDPVLSDQAAINQSQRLFGGVSETMHNLAHAYHSLSDILCDFSQPPPRTLRCRPLMIHHSTVVQTGIPVQITGNLANVVNQQASSPENPTPSANDSGTQTNVTVLPQRSEATVTVSQPPAESPAQTTPTTATDTPPRQPQSPADTPPRLSRLVGSGAGGPGIEFVLDVNPASITIDSLEATVVPNASPNTTEPNQTWQNPPEFVQNLITALAGQFMGATLQHYRIPDQQNTSTNTQQAAVSSSAATSAQPNAQPSLAQNSQARGNTATHPTTATQTRSTARPHVHHLSPTLTGLRPSSMYDPFLSCSSHHIRNSRAGSNIRVGNARNPDSSASISISLEARGNRLINLDRHPTRLLRLDPQMPPELQSFFRALSASNILVNGQTSMTVAHLLSNFGGFNYVQGQSILSDITMTLAECLTVFQLIQLGIGNSECLVQARPQFRQLITQRLLNNEPFSTSAMTNFINRVNEALRTYINILCRDASLHPDVDVAASINLCNHTLIPVILRALYEGDESTFRRTIWDKCAEYIYRIYAILQFCFIDGYPALLTAITMLVREASSNVPRSLQQWIMTHSLTNFQAIRHGFNIPADDVQSYLVFRAGSHITPLHLQSTDSQLPRTVSVAEEPMDVQEVESTQSINRETPVADVVTPPQREVEKTNTPSWQDEIPSDWVPVITRDIQRQRRSGPQVPFSDAYLSSMPSKRRKLITAAKTPQGNLNQVLSDNMATALGAAGMSTSSPQMDLIVQRAGQDANLRRAYREELRSAFRNTIRSNPDFVPEKYPNATKYFKTE